ncbi:hypothetical protein [Nesterenkonia flava]|uniref:Acyl-CoA carboxylase subunit epsilon n=1 Tax=Nesterenkonia flava TaxID=469799 RepID=A0ABU1FQH1_9MICC|nr:hypothetical protein [Nesterenkonia flava]MDR5710879.1 hypothetical protein [Nesterenkonia flava]
MSALQMPLTTQPATPAASASTPSEAAEFTPAESAAAAESSPLRMRGADLSAEEVAAVVAVISRLAAQAEEQDDDAGTTGPRDRASLRHQRMTQNHHGLWGRPGTSSWRMASGGMR